MNRKSMLLIKQAEQEVAKRANLRAFKESFSGGARVQADHLYVDSVRGKKAVAELKKRALKYG